MTVRPAHRRVLRLHPDDDVAVAVDALAPGDIAHGVAVTARVPRGHKVALRALEPGRPVRKFGQPIGVALVPIAPGDWVHEHNLGVDAGGAEARVHAIGEGAPAEALLPVDARATFEGFSRPAGRAGTRNYVGILTSVNCSASVATFVAREALRLGLLDDHPTIDGVIPLVHGGGCALDVKGEGFAVLKRTQWGYAANPNMAAVLMIGLGCEGFQVRDWMAEYGLVEGERFRQLTIQEVGGTRKAVEAGVAALRDLLPVAGRARRETRPAAELTLALQCGGSDGYSGITANPALGAAADLLGRHGGTAILSETPEIYGAEHLLTRRAISRAVGERLLERVRWWEDYTARNRMVMNNNPSPGNKAGGLTTILEKSLGAAAKGGTGALRAVYEYAEPVRERGLVFMDTPGYDPVSATGQVAGGATLLAFTTGRGSAYGCKPTPSLKLATNTAVYERMIDDMDVNCGDVLDGVSVEAKGAEIFAALLRVAGGERTKSEALGYGEAEFVPWIIGATM